MTSTACLQELGLGAFSAKQSTNSTLSLSSVGRSFNSKSEAPNSIDRDSGKNA